MSGFCCFSFEQALDRKVIRKLRGYLKGAEKTEELYDGYCLYHEDKWLGTCLTISFCPFCGKSLYEIKSK